MDMIRKRPNGQDVSEARAEVDGYTPLQIALHWAIAGLVLVQLLLNGAIEVAFDARMDGDPALHGFIGQALTVGHIAIGSTILFLAVWRLAVRLSVGPPAPSMPAPRAIVLIGKVAHIALYAFILVMPMTGLVAWVLKSDLAGELHEWLRWPFILLIIGHSLGALFEHMVFGNKTLERMLRSEVRSASGRE
jgi:cytochrome b561